jgi:hypothetical protein
MWALLSDPRHSTGFDHLGEAYAPLRRLVEQLAGREFAGRVYAFRWMASFNLTAAPTAGEAAGRDGVGIEYDPDQGIFRVCYDDRAHPDRRPRVLTASPHEVGELIDRHVQRLLLAPRPSGPEPADAQGVLAVVLVAAMFVFGVSWALKWAGAATDLVMIVSMAAVALSTGLYLLGGALMPRWERGLWRTSKVGLPSRELPRVRVEIGRLVFLGAGIWFTAGGLTFLAGAALGLEDGLPKPALWVLLGALAVGGVIFLVGLRSDQRRFDAARAVEDAQQRADLHP